MTVSRVQAAPDEPYHYVGPKTKRFIVWFVVAAHVSIFVIPGLVFAFISWLKPNMVLVSKVVLVDSAPNDHKTPSRNPGSAPEVNNDPVPPPDLPDIPKIQEVQPPTPPPPVQRPKTVVKKTDPVPKPPVQKPEKVVPAPEKKVQPPKKTSAWKPLDSKDIKIQPGKRSNPRTAANQKSSALEKLAKDLRTNAAPGGAGGPMGKYSPDANDYYQKVGAYLRSKWVDQPDVSALGGSRPFVVVMFHISPNGRILSTRIEQPSGVAVMDASVQRFLRTLTVLPAPPNRNMTRFSVTMRIED